jgi:hypothetical protein
MKRLKKFGFGLAVSMAPFAAFAQGGIDTTDVTAQITAAATAVLAIGAAVVAGPKIAVKVFKWIGRAL